jgi:hypothetical protein
MLLEPCYAEAFRLADLAFLNKNNIDRQAATSRHASESRTAPNSATRYAMQNVGNVGDAGDKGKRNGEAPGPFPLDLVEAINGMHRLLDLISETGSNGCGAEFLGYSCVRRS